MPHRIAVLGSGPRGLITVERLAARLSETDCPPELEIHLIDAVEVGAGRVYRTDQPEWFLMNTVAGMVSAFSGVPDGGPVRAGAGPSLYEWWAARDPEHASPDGYASRADYGRYTRYLLDAVEAGLPDGVRLVRTLARVTDLDRLEPGYRLHFTDRDPLEVAAVVLSTGHSVPEPVGTQREMVDFAAAHGLRYLPGDSAADLDLATLGAGEAVGVLGLGLAFYDVLAACTEGRGGRFTERADGSLRYLPSGTEPLLVAGSRSGVPVPARGRNQKPPRHAYRPVLFTVDNIRATRPSGPLDFRTDVLPWLLAEMDLVHAATELRLRSGTSAAEAFTRAVAAASGTHGPPAVPELAAAHGLPGLPHADLDALARPFTGESFVDAAAFDARLTALLRADIAEADRGNVDSPVKAALDVLRDVRGMIMRMADFGGLRPASHRDDFIGWYAQRVAFLAAGPPASRMRQVLALRESGHLRVIGPQAEFGTDPDAGRFTVSSPRVGGATVPVDSLVDARIPEPDLARDTSPLTVRLREQGIWTAYVNTAGTETFRTGGVAVTSSPYHPVDVTGRADTGLYVVGIPTEHTRWFMQVGSNRPGLWGDFVHDGDAIAAHLLKGLR